MKLTIYYGAPRPMVAIGNNQCRLLGFAEKFPCWHYYSKKDRATVRAIDALARKNYLKVDRGRQAYKINYPDVY